MRFSAAAFVALLLVAACGSKQASRPLHGSKAVSERPVEVLFRHVPRGARVLDVVNVQAARARLGLAANASLLFESRTNTTRPGQLLISAAGAALPPQVIIPTGPDGKNIPLGRALDTGAVTAAVSTVGPSARSTVFLIATTEPRASIEQGLRSTGFKGRGSVWSAGTFHVALFAGGLAASYSLRTTRAAAAQRIGPITPAEFAQLAGTGYAIPLAFATYSARFSPCLEGFTVSDDLSPHTGRLTLLIRGRANPQLAGSDFFEQPRGIVLGTPRARQLPLSPGLGVVGIPLSANTTDADATAFVAQPMVLSSASFYSCP